MISRRQFIGLALPMLMLGCRSSRPQYNTVVIESDRYVDELYDAWWYSKAALIEVGAPVRDFKGLIRVGWTTECRVPGSLGYHDGRAYSRILPQNRIIMCLAPDGSFQPRVARAEFVHFHVGMDDGDKGTGDDHGDYYWSRKASLMI